MTDRQARAYSVRHHQGGLRKLEKATEIISYDEDAKIATLGLNGNVWEKIDISANACALCRLYVQADGDCKNCPICKTIGKLDCWDTPWEALADALANKDLPAD